MNDNLIFMLDLFIRFIWDSLPGIRFGYMQVSSWSNRSQMMQKINSLFHFLTVHSWLWKQTLKIIPGNGVENRTWGFISAQYVPGQKVHALVESNHDTGNTELRSPRRSGNQQGLYYFSSLWLYSMLSYNIQSQHIVTPAFAV